MSHRRNEYLERLQEHMDEREWTDADKEHFLHMVGHSALLSTQSALSVLEFQQLTDERIEAEKEYDQTFFPNDSDPSFVQHGFEETL